MPLRSTDLAIAQLKSSQGFPDPWNLKCAKTKWKMANPMAVRAEGDGIGTTAQEVMGM